MSVNAEDVMTVINAMIGRIQSFDASAVWPECERVMLVGVGDNFLAMQASDGSPWAPRKDAKTHPLLKLTSAMYGAATSPGAAGHISAASADQLKFGIDVGAIKYARAQNKGYLPRNLPPREYMYVSDQVLSQVQLILWNEAKTQLF